ncbi:MAG: SCO family protein [Flavobacteriales bacterium]|nr:SCO family protein [Flavobacteriales bacterium]
MKAVAGARTRKYLVLFALLLLPSLLYLYLIQGKHNFAHLPFVTYMDEQGDLQVRKAPVFAFPDQNGDTLRSLDMRGRIYLVDFFFTSCPSICPIMTANMTKVHERFQHYDDFQIISITVDPKRDTPEMLKEYVVSRKIDSPKWHFLTGDKDSLYAVAYKFLSSAMEDNAAPGGFLHTEYFVLIDKEGNMRSREDDNGNIIGVYDGTNSAHINDLIDDIKILIAEYNLELKKNNRHSQTSDSK